MNDTEQRLRRTLLALGYQALTGNSDLRVTIFCPGLSRNADLATIGVASLTVSSSLLLLLKFTKCVTLKLLQL